MTKPDGKVEQLLAKHPSLTKQEALKIVADKNERKRKKREGKLRTSSLIGGPTRQEDPSLRMRQSRPAERSKGIHERTGQ